jgi:hypothetical protein
MARRWGTAVVVGLVVVFGVGGAVYLWKEAETDTNDAQGDDFVGDASADARAGGKRKPSKKGARGGKPRGGGGKPRGGGGGGGAGGGDDPGDDPGGGVAIRPFTGRGPAGPTYEAAIAANKQEIAIGSQGAPDLTDVQLSGPMRNGGFVGECGAPDGMKVTVKVAIKLGRPVGVSVYASPPDPDVAGCIDRYVRTFAWPSNAKMDSFTTTY